MSRAQLVLVDVAPEARGRYATGQQELCAPCAAAGVVRQGVSRDGDGSEPLCMSCWTAREQRRARAQQVEQLRQLWDERAELDTAAAAAETCAACGAREASHACWLCGYAWLREQRALFEADQAAAAAELEARFERIAALTEAEARVADVTGWIERLRMIVAAYAVNGGKGRAVELLADLLARLAAVRTSTRGRPSVVPYVGAVLAADSNWQSGNRSLPGRERTAWLIGCSDRAVHDAWRAVVRLDWATRVRVGGRNTLERREATGRPNDRAEFDLHPLHCSPVDVATRAQFVPAALQLFDELLEHALVVLAAEQAALDLLRARCDTVTELPEQIRRVQLRAAVAETRSTIAQLTPADLSTGITCRSHTVSKGEYLSSCCSYWGYAYPAKTINSVEAGQPQCGEGKSGASRSSTWEGAGAASELASSQRLRRPRTTQADARQSRPRQRPAWASWASELARDLVVLWPWLAQALRPRVVATLGSRLGPDWTAADVVAWIHQYRTMPVLDAPDNPLGYLVVLLDDALASDVVPPYVARRHDEQRRQEVVAAAEVQRAEGHLLGAELDVRDAAAAAATGSGRAAMAAMQAALAARRQANARAAAERAARQARLADEAWSDVEVRQPGSDGAVQR
jgi:hypothetical protein